MEEKAGASPQTGPEPYSEPYPEPEPEPNFGALSSLDVGFLEEGVFYADMGSDLNQPDTFAAVEELGGLANLGHLEHFEHFEHLGTHHTDYLEQGFLDETRWRADKDVAYPPVTDEDAALYGMDKGSLHRCCGCGDIIEIKSQVCRACSRSCSRLLQPYLHAK